MSPNPVGLTLTNDEALVLFEFLARFHYDKQLTIEDPAEERVLGCLQGQLESHLVELFLPNYVELVQEARSRLHDPERLNRSTSTQEPRESS
jgi:hypothetical protein